jgi:hypothetical protein
MKRLAWVNLVDFAMSALPSAIHDTRHSHIQSGRVYSCLTPELQIIRVTGWLRMMASIDSRGRAITKEPAYRLHETGTQSALVMRFPVFA